jgi:hypothetical protein
MKRLNIPIATFAASILAGAAVSVALAQSSNAPSLEHPKIAEPATLSGARAEAVYRAIRGQVRANYAASGDPVTLSYQTWKRYNKTPYRSKNHGERFVNHYANAKAADYGKFENLKELPVGSIVIKDSFSVTQTGAVMTGPFFMMEKMGPGFAPADGNWRYLMLRPDGSMVGMTGGPDGPKMKFCADCHKGAGVEHDFMFFMPEEARIPAER